MEGGVGDSLWMVRDQQYRMRQMVRATVLELGRGMKASLGWSSLNATKN